MVNMKKYETYSFKKDVLTKTSYISETTVDK